MFEKPGQKLTKINTIFKRPGQKLMTVSSILVLLGMAGSIIAFIALCSIDGSLFAFGLLVLIAGPAASYISGLALYAFGQMVDHMEDMHDQATSVQLSNAMDSKPVQTAPSPAAFSAQSAKDAPRSTAQKRSIDQSPAPSKTVQAQPIDTGIIKQRVREALEKTDPADAELIRQHVREALEKDGAEQLVCLMELKEHSEFPEERELADVALTAKDTNAALAAFLE